MSGFPSAGPGGPPPSGSAVDPSMEDILASIRRILSEDEAAPEAAAGPSPEPSPAPSPPADEFDVLALDASMLVEEPPERSQPERSKPEPVAQAAPPEPPAPLQLAAAGLVAPAAAAAAASSVGTLVRALAEHQSLTVYRGGPTLEDIVREEMRPILKVWLDEHLPPMVERLVRSEIERVVGRSVP